MNADLITRIEQADGPRVRYRLHRRWFREPLIVVQVPETVPYNFDPATDIRPGGYCERWRDAKAGDIMNAAILRAERNEP